MDSPQRFDMNVQFRYQGALIEPSEAQALFSLAKKTEKKPFEINLDSLIDFKLYDSKALFDLAVDQNSETLASLALKVSVEQRKKTQIKTEKIPSKPIKKTREVEDKDIDTLISTLASSSNFSSIGATIILNALKNGEEKSLREIAVETINYMHNQKGVVNSKFLKGFEFKDGALKPISFRAGLDRKNTFHVSPMYLSLREGLILCEEEKLAVKESRISQGTLDGYGTKSTAIEKMQRVYYTVKLTPKGMELADQWGDIEKYVYSNIKYK